MKLNLAKAALEGVAIKIQNGADQLGQQVTINTAHESILHHMRMKYTETESVLRLYFVVNGCKVYAGGDLNLDLVKTRHRIACSFDPSGLLSKVKALVLDQQMNVVFEF